MASYNLKAYISKFTELEKREAEQNLKLKKKNEKEEKKRNSPDYEILQEIAEDNKKENEKRKEEEEDEGDNLVNKICIHNKILMKIVKVSSIYVYYIEYLKKYQFQFSDDVLFQSFGDMLYISEFTGTYKDHHILQKMKPKKILFSKFYSHKIIDDPITDLIFVDDFPIIKRGSIFENNYNNYDKMNELFKLRYLLRSIGSGHINVHTDPPRYEDIKYNLLKDIKQKLQNLTEDEIYRRLYDLKTYDIYTSTLPLNPYRGWDYVSIYKKYVKDK